MEDKRIRYFIIFFNGVMDGKEVKGTHVQPWFTYPKRSIIPARVTAAFKGLENVSHDNIIQLSKDDAESYAESTFNEDKIRKELIKMNKQIAKSKKGSLLKKLGNFLTRF